MADIPSAGTKITTIQVAANNPLTETLFTSLGQAINDNIDKNITNAAGIATNVSDIDVLEAQFDFDESLANTGGLGGGGNVVIATPSIVTTTGRIQVTVKGTLLKSGGTGTGTYRQTDLSISIDGVKQASADTTWTIGDESTKQGFCMTQTFSTSATGKVYGLYFISSAGGGSSSQPSVVNASVQALEL